MNEPESPIIAELNERFNKWLEEQKASFWRNGTGDTKIYRQYRDDLKYRRHYSFDSFEGTDLDRDIAMYMLFTDHSSIVGIITSMLKDILYLEMKLNERSVK